MMRYPARIVRWVTIAVLLGVGGLALTGCLRIKDSPAPGCVRTIGIRPMGGCFGRTVIVDLVVEPEIACLIISPNNCNGGVLTIRNGCTEPLLLDNGYLEIPAGDRASLDVVEVEGQWQAIQVHSNVSECTPPEDHEIEFHGSIGLTEITIGFTKTAPLCDNG